MFLAEMYIARTLLRQMATFAVAVAFACAGDQSSVATGIPEIVGISRLPLGVSGRKLAGGEGLAAALINERMTLGRAA